jgi:phage-related protein
MSDAMRVRLKTSARQPGRHKGSRPAGFSPERQEARRFSGQAVQRQASPQELFDRATREPASALPHQQALEQRVGHSLSHVRVYSGPAAQTALQAMGAQAAARGHEILLAEADPGLEVLLHEVAHVLQSEQTAPATQQAVAPEDSPPEQEARGLAETARDGLAQGASTAAEPPLPGGVRAGLHPRTIALQRATQTDPYPALRQEWVVAPEQAFTATVAESPASEPASTAPTAQPAPAQAAPAPSAAAPTAAPVGEAAEPGAAATETPDLGEARAPEAGPTAAVQPQAGEAQAAAQAAAQATAALQNAKDVDELVEKFAAAPPTVKAQHAAQVGQRAGEFTQQDAAQIQSEAPELHAELNSPVQAPPPLRVESPPASPVTLEATTPPPAPEPDIPATPEARPFTGNQGVTNQLEQRLSSASDGESTARAAEVGQSLRDVQTSDPGVETSPGPPPTVPLEGDTDPARVQNQAQAGSQQAQQARTEAQQAVVQGPGPEQVQPRQMDETYSVPGLVQPKVSAPPTPEGPQQYLAMNLPPDVQASFDQAQAPAMQASLQGAQTQISQATQQRDQERESKTQQAQAEAERLSQDANQQQSQRVLEARQQIQGERQHTLEAQNQEVARVEGDIENRRGQDSQAIDGRVQSDQQQIQDRYTQTEQQAQDKVRNGEQQAEEKRQQAEHDAENQSWWDRAVNFIKDAFNALTRAIGAIFDAVRAAVNGLLDAAKAFAQRLIDAAAQFIKSAIAAFGEFLKGLVNTLLGDIFPGLAAALNRAIDAAVQLAERAVDQVANVLKEGINKLVEGLRAGLNAVINAYQAAVQTVLAVVEAAITGDWSALLKKVLEAVLRLIGVNPEEFYAFVGRAEETFQIIVNDPGGFLGHLLDAVVGGFRQFADNFLTHLQAGIIGWLTGALGGAGITIPEHFDLMGVLSLVQQILGLTWDRLREKAVRLIGEQAVSILEFVVSYLQTLIQGGWPALFERIQQDLSNLVDIVLDGIKNFLLERIVIAAITRLATLFNPVGAIVQLVMAAWNLYTFLRDKLARIIQVVQTVVDAIGNIARGIIGPAVLKVEQVLASLLPLAIDLLARFLGLGGIAEKVREIIEKVRAAVDRAIDNLIERIKGLFRGGGQAQEQPQQEAPAGDIDEVVTIGAHRHTLRAHIENGRPKILMASNEFLEIGPHVENIRKLYIGEKKQFHPDSDLAKELNQELEAIQDRTVQILQTAQAENDEVKRSIILRSGLDELNQRFGKLGGPPFKLETEQEFQPPAHRTQGLGLDNWGRSKGYLGVPISSASEGQGGRASTDPSGLKILSRVPGIPQYERGHLLAGTSQKSLGGPGNDVGNLAPMSQQTNDPGMKNGPEADARGKIYDPNANPAYLLNYSVRCEYRGDAELRNKLNQLGANPNAVQVLFNMAKNNADLDDAAILSAIGSPNKPLTQNDYNDIRQRLAYVFMPFKFTVQIEPKQGPLLNITNYTVDNHIGVTLV